MSENKQPLEWKLPNEILRLQRLKQKKKALQARLVRPSGNFSQEEIISIESIPAIKRKNPFSKNTGSNKKAKEDGEILNEPEDSLFQLIAESTAKESVALEAPLKRSISLPQTNFRTFPSFNHQPIIEEDTQKPTEFLPMDWSLKTRLRILSKTVLPGNTLKTSQEASGMTSFVRCIDPTEDSETGLDISPGAQFHQSTLYWQHPHLPWLTLFPRSAKCNNGFVLGEPERACLYQDWTNSFRALFQLVRSRQCPYFYVCANSFNVLFRAAGIGGRVETHVYLTPTSRGMRAALKQEEIEFTMPLKPESLNKSLETDKASNPSNQSFSNSCEDSTQLEESDDDMEEDEWLESLGVDASEIKKMQTKQARKNQKVECEDDFSDQSCVLIEGPECQAFFNFLLNAKSTTTKTGKLAGIPPTLLAPVAFHGACLRSLQVRPSKVRMDHTDYFSMELKGVILPHVLPYLSNFLKATKDSFSATMSTYPTTIALSKATQKSLDQDKENKEAPNTVFGRENLSDCGLTPLIVESMCRIGEGSVNLLERMCYSKEQGGFTWS